MANKPDGKKKKSNDKSQKGVKPVAQAKPPKAVKQKGAVPDFRKKEDRLTPAQKIEISFGKSSNELGRMANGF